MPSSADERGGNLGFAAFLKSSAERIQNDESLNEWKFVVGRQFAAVVVVVVVGTAATVSWRSFV